MNVFALVRLIKIVNVYGCNIAHDVQSVVWLLQWHSHTHTNNRRLDTIHCDAIKNLLVVYCVFARANSMLQLLRHEFHLPSHVCVYHFAISNNRKPHWSNQMVFG